MALKRSLDFDFHLVQNVPHHLAREAIRRCDVYVDQLVYGAHGQAAVEAMALGKPVICYISPYMADRYPVELPIVSATRESLPEILARLITDPALRRRLGEQGRAYVEKYHDSRPLALQLMSIYNGLSFPCAS